MKPTALLTAALLLAVAPASAQPPDVQPSPEAGQGRAMAGQRRAERLADVRIILRIRPDQEQAYQAFMASLQRPRDDAGATPQQPGDTEAAYQSFSAVLTPDQQQVLAALRRLTLDRPRWGGRRRGPDGGAPEGGPQ